MAIPSSVSEVTFYFPCIAPVDLGEKEFSDALEAIDCQVDDYLTAWERGNTVTRFTTHLYILNHPHNERTDLFKTEQDIQVILALHGFVRSEEIR